jgi:hypothetical protein
MLLAAGWSQRWEAAEAVFPAAAGDGACAAETETWRAATVRRWESSEELCERRKRKRALCASRTASSVQHSIHMNEI